MAHAEVERDGGVMTVTMNRPHRYNAMTLTMFAQLADAWQEASEDPGIRCVILTGAGGNFSSGMDLRAMAGDADEEGAIDTDAPHERRTRASSTAASSRRSARPSR